ncbi:MAG: hypothetical protein P4M02_11555 [Clostridia bacterium]|nr:hypothetical protein [Clostridia bacterium]
MKILSKNPWLHYLYYAVIVFAFIFAYSIIVPLVQFQADSVGYAYPFVLIELIGNLIFGILLGLENLLKERQNVGKWIFNIPRFILIGIPSFIFGCFYFIFMIPVIGYIPNLMISTLFITINQVLFSYCVTTNFSKQSITD